MSCDEVALQGGMGAVEHRGGGRGPLELLLLRRQSGEEVERAAQAVAFYGHAIKTPNRVSFALWFSNQSDSIWVLPVQLVCPIIVVKSELLAIYSKA